MKKLIGFVVMLMGVFVIFGMFVNVAHAEQENDKWTKVHADWTFFHGYYKKSPNGVVHDKWACNSDWEDCAGYGLYYPTSKFAEAPDDNVCGNVPRPLIWEGTTEYGDDEGDASDFLVVGETYWFCDAFEVEIFRGSE
jgi:hypothetical protein